MLKSLALGQMDVGAGAGPHLQFKHCRLIMLGSFYIAILSGVFSRQILYCFLGARLGICLLCWERVPCICFIQEVLCINVEKYKSRMGEQVFVLTIQMPRSHVSSAWVRYLPLVLEFQFLLVHALGGSGNNSVPALHYPGKRSVAC